MKSIFKRLISLALVFGAATALYAEKVSGIIKGDGELFFVKNGAALLHGQAKKRGAR